MSDIKTQLNTLQQRIADSNEPDTPADYLQRLTVTKTGGNFNLDFYGDCFGEYYQELLNTLAQPVVAPQIRSLILRGPDEGADGTHNWDIQPLVATHALFLQLQTFSIQLNNPGDHNQSIVGAYYEEDGVLAKLLAKAPQLRELTVPSAPNAAFFDVGPRPIRFLSVDAGYDTQNFIVNLAKSTCFPSLRCFEWGEFNERYIDDYLANCTAFEDYVELFKSNAFIEVTRFVWRNPACTDDQIKGLKKLKPNLQFLVVKNSEAYV